LRRWRRRHTAHALLGDDGVALLARDGNAIVFQFAVPGQAAVDAAHPFFNIEDLRARGEVPNVVSEFLKAWSYRVAHPDFDPRTLGIDCGLMFRSAVPASWITNAETLAG
jgi:hypothetical protein